MKQSVRQLSILRFAEKTSFHSFTHCPSPQTNRLLVKKSIDELRLVPLVWYCTMCGCSVKQNRYICVYTEIQKTLNCSMKQRGNRMSFEGLQYSNNQSKYGDRDLSLFFCVLKRQTVYLSPSSLAHVMYMYNIYVLVGC